jgi:hypothetical protein
MAGNQRSQITMTEAEISSFVEKSRTATMATLSADGMPHLIAMWFAIVDGEIWFETKDGLTYDTLRGVSMEGTGMIVEDPEALFAVGISVWERYTGPYTEDLRPAVDAMLHKRVAVRFVPDRTRSWDHRKLGMPAIPLSGSTAPPS